MTKSDESDGSKITQVSDIDFGYPLYLHPSDTSTTALISLKLKGTENYNWDICNSVALSWILKSISEDLFVAQVFSVSAKVVWDELKETYVKIDESITYNLHHKINSITQSGSTISDYYHKLISLWKQFDALVKLPTCVYDANKDFKTHNDLIYLMHFLMGLDDSFSTISSNILTSDPLPNVKYAFTTISREESHRGSSQALTNKSQSSTFLVSKTFDNSKRVGKGPNPNLKCTKCNRDGHTIDRCYEVVGYPSWWVKGYNTNKNLGQKVGYKNNNAMTNDYSQMSNSATCARNSEKQNSSSYPFSSEQINKLTSLIKDNSLSGNAHIIWEIVDSGASQHITGSSDNMTNLVDVSRLNLTVGHPNGTLAKIDRFENLKIKNNLVLLDVLVISGYCVSHLSVHKLSKDNKLIMVFLVAVLVILFLLKSDTADLGILLVRAVWVFLLKSKDETVDNIKSFVQLLNNKFGVKVKNIRSDNETEFVNQNFNSFCTEKGIIHQTTCAYTPQQNGIAERKLMHVLSVARSLLFKKNIDVNSEYFSFFESALKPSINSPRPNDEWRADIDSDEASGSDQNDTTSSSSEASGSGHLGDTTSLN
ncbi:uncharacterized protein [Rutidosis leptorrhynchoides]|uniref:uncharacterized protein n=1 Tax=Rutidosis leptorrhynchoides TaxID=125765 RepID=UPI003A9A60C6